MVAASLTDLVDIAVDATDVYCLGGTGTLTRVSKFGGPPTVLVSVQDTFSRLALDDSGVYWTAPGSGSVQMVPKTGGAVTTLAVGQVEPRHIALGPQNVYWTLAGDQGAVLYTDKGGATGPTWLADSTKVSGLALDDQGAYWSQLTGEIYYIVFGAPGPSVVTANHDWSRALKVAGPMIYWIGDFSQILSAPAETGIVTPLYSGFPLGGSDLAIDNVNAYWELSTTAGQSTYSYVSKVALDGGPFTLLLEGTLDVGALEVDDTDVYFTDRLAGQLLRVPK